MLPIVTKAVHVCTIHNLTESCDKQVSTHHADNCGICHFAFLTFDRAKSLVLESMIVIMVFATAFHVILAHSYEKAGTASLRAPPHHL